MSVETIKKYKFISQLKKLPFVKRVILFGSRARGDQADRSDIDIAIDCPEATGKQWHKVLKIINEADTLLLIDCVDLRRASEGLKKNILKDGISL
jgi:predicted nucleotidyltransferase